jgi:hypothetical protein
LAAFTVHEPPSIASAAFERAESLVFVKEAFSWRALLFGPLYFLARGEWLALAAYVAAAALAVGVLELFGAADDLTGFALLLLNVIAGFEASELERWSLARAGWREVGTVTAARRDDAERRFFDAWLPSVPAATPEHELRAPPDPTFGGKVAAHAEALVRRLAGRLHAPSSPKI